MGAVVAQQDPLLRMAAETLAETLAETVREKSAGEMVESTDIDVQMQVLLVEVD